MSNLLYNLYQEIPKETQQKISKPRKFCTTAINLALSVVLMDTPIGNHAIRLILTALGISPLSASHLQRQSNHVSKLIINLNTEDMSMTRELLLEHNNLTGSSSPREITCSVDCRYNARSFHSSQKPGEASSQAYTVAIENMTNDQHIIGLAVENKLCWSEAWLEKRGYMISCPNGYAGCIYFKCTLPCSTFRAFAIFVNSQNHCPSVPRTTRCTIYYPTKLHTCGS